MQEALSLEVDVRLAQYDSQARDYDEVICHLYVYGQLMRYWPGPVGVITLHQAQVNGIK